MITARRSDACGVHGNTSPNIPEVTLSPPPMFEEVTIPILGYFCTAKPCPCLV